MYRELRQPFEMYRQIREPSQVYRQLRGTSEVYTQLSGHSEVYIHLALSHLRLEKFAVFVVLQRVIPKRANIHPSNFRRRYYLHACSP